MKWSAKGVVGAIAALLLLMQFVPVDRSNPPVTGAMALPEGEVGDLLRTSCFDCHSNETRWPWYSAVAPASYLVGRHVAKGRGEMNFSTWGAADALRRNHVLEEVVEVMESEEMPPSSYLMLHADARLTTAQREQIMEWAEDQRAELEIDAGLRGEEAPPPPTSGAGGGRP